MGIKNQGIVHIGVRPSLCGESAVASYGGHDYMSVISYRKYHSDQTTYEYKEEGVVSPFCIKCLELLPLVELAESL